MSVILEFTIGSEKFMPGRVLSGPPPMHIQLERIVPTESTLIPFLWVTGEDFETFEENVVANPAVEDLVALDRIEDSTLYRVTWNRDQNNLIDGIIEAEGTVLEAHGDGGWEFRLRLSNHDKLSQFYNYCTDHDIPIHITRAYTLTEPADSVKQFGLSEEQREALLLGLREGYFDTPSRVSLSELADELEISQQAVSNRIRRGTKKVLGKALLSSAADFE